MAGGAVVFPFFIHVPALTVADRRGRYERGCDTTDRECTDKIIKYLTQKQGWANFPGTDGHYVSDKIIGIAFGKFACGFTGAMTPMNWERRAMQLGWLMRFYFEWKFEKNQGLIRISRMSKFQEMDFPRMSKIMNFKVNGLSKKWTFQETDFPRNELSKK